MPKSWSALAVLSAATLVACFDTSKPDDDDDDGGGADGGWDPGSDTGNRGTDGGGAGDGGGPDDPDSDTDTETETDTDTDTGIMLNGARGEADVRVGMLYEGWEETYFTGLGPHLDCRVTSAMVAIEAVDTCAACSWAFIVEAQDSVLSSTVGCEFMGLTDASGWDGVEYGYGFEEDYKSFGDVLSYYFSGYGWYPVAYAEFSSGRLTYDWPRGYYYYYRD